jgi:hypothetical protein
MIQNCYNLFCVSIQEWLSLQREVLPCQKIWKQIYGEHPSWLSKFVTSFRTLCFFPGDLNIGKAFCWTSWYSSLATDSRYCLITSLDSQFPRLREIRFWMFIIRWQFFKRVHIANIFSSLLAQNYTLILSAPAESLVSSLSRDSVEYCCLKNILNHNIHKKLTETVLILDISLSLGLERGQEHKTAPLSIS